MVSAMSVSARSAHRTCSSVKYSCERSIANWTARLTTPSARFPIILSSLSHNLMPVPPLLSGGSHGPERNLSLATPSSLLFLQDRCPQHHFHYGARRA